MRIFVISLSRSIERRDHLRACLDALGVPFTFFEAVDLRVDRNHYFHHCDDREFLRNTGRAPGVAELGCFASHRMLWCTARYLGEPVVILEDDAQPTAALRDGLRFVASHIDRLGFVRLQTNRYPAAATVAERRRFGIYWHARYPYGAMAYAISPAAADRLVSASDVIDAPVDGFIKRYWQHGQALYSLAPAVFESSHHSRRSTVQPLQAPPAGIFARLQRFMRKRRDGARRACFNLRWRLLARPATCRREWRASEPVVERQADARRGGF